MAERMTESLSRRLPQQLSNISAEQSARRAAPKPKAESQKSDQPSLQASVQGPSQPSGQAPQGAGEDPGERPRLRLPDDKPLGAAGPSRDKKIGPEDGGFMVLEDRWRLGLPRNPRLRQGSILNPHRPNLLKGGYPIIRNNNF